MQRCAMELLESVPKFSNFFLQCTELSNNVLKVNVKKSCSLGIFCDFCVNILFKCGLLWVGPPCGHPETTMTAEIRMHPVDEICLMCAKIIEGPSTPLFESPDLMNLFITVIGFQLKQEEYLPENICLTCVFTLSRMLEIQKTIKRNILHFKMNYQYRNASEKSKLILNTNVIRNSNPNGLIISDVRGQVQVADDHFTYSSFDEDLVGDVDICLGGKTPKTDPASPSSNNSNRNTPRLLRPLYMRVENVRDTESDGAIYSETTPFQCSMCSKIFSRRGLLTRHVNSCHRPRSRASSKAPEERKKSMFKCRNCDEKFSELRLLNKHKIIHRNNFTCSNCLKVFHLKRELDWHEAECLGKKSAGDGRNLNRRTTRLQSTVGQFMDEDFGATEEFFNEAALRQLSKTPTPFEKLQSVQNWCNTAGSNSSAIEPDPEPPQSPPSNHLEEDAQTTISHFTSISQKTAYSSVSYRSCWSSASISIRTNYSYKSARTVKTLKSERDYLQSCRVTRSIANRIKKIEMEIKVRELPQRKFGGTRSTATSRRHFDITKRTKIVRGNRRLMLPDAFVCDCSFTSKNLREFMEHEVGVHRKLPLFTCKECNKRFTQRRFLEKHQENHNKTYTCVWCFTKFVNEGDLKTHLDLHAVNSIQCVFCEASFINQKEFKEHVDDMHANENKKSTKKSCILIRIGQKKRNVTEKEKEYKSIELPQKSDPKIKMRRTRSYSQYSTIRLGSVARERSPAESSDCTKSQAENGISEVPREQILLPVAMDICRYSTPSPQISDSHERGSSKLTATPPPSLEELGVFDTNFSPVPNGNSETSVSEKNGHEEDGDYSPVGSPSGRRKRSKARITLTQRVTRQTLAQPLPLVNGVENVLPPYESWPLHRTSVAVKPGILPQPCRMT